VDATPSPPPAAAQGVAAAARVLPDPPAAPAGPDFKDQVRSVPPPAAAAFNQRPADNDNNYGPNFKDVIMAPPTQGDEEDSGWSYIRDYKDQIRSAPPTDVLSYADIRDYKDQIRSAPPTDVLSYAATPPDYKDQIRSAPPTDVLSYAATPPDYKDQIRTVQSQMPRRKAAGRRDVPLESTNVEPPVAAAVHVPAGGEVRERTMNCF